MQASRATNTGPSGMQVTVEVTICHPGIKNDPQRDSIIFQDSEHTHRLRHKFSTGLNHPASDELLAEFRKSQGTSQERLGERSNHSRRSKQRFTMASQMRSLPVERSTQLSWTRPNGGPGFSVVVAGHPRGATLANSASPPERSQGSSGGEVRKWSPECGEMQEGRRQNTCDCWAATAGVPRSTQRMGVCCGAAQCCGSLLWKPFQKHEAQCSTPPNGKNVSVGSSFEKKNARPLVHCRMLAAALGQLNRRRGLHASVCVRSLTPSTLRASFNSSISRCCLF